MSECQSGLKFGDHAQVWISKHLEFSPIILDDKPQKIV